MKTFMKVILLHTIDDAWKLNLRDLDDLKQSVQNAQYEQKDPLLIYKLESYHIFERMVQKLNSKAVSILMRGQLHMPEQEEVKEAAPERRQDFSRMQASHAQAQSSLADRQAASARQQSNAQQEPVQRTPIVAQPHVGRNEPCPCGSGLKYKNCHGKNL